jgi:hypothetical protein
VQLLTNMVQRYRKRISDPLMDRRDGPWACGSAPTYDLSFRTLSVFVTTELDSQRIVHYGLTGNPTDARVAQQLRYATPFSERRRYLIRDNDSEYTPSFEQAAVGIEALRTPCRARRAHAKSERFLGGLRHKLWWPRTLIRSKTHHSGRTAQEEWSSRAADPLAEGCRAWDSSGEMIRNDRSIGGDARRIAGATSDL